MKSEHRAIVAYIAGRIISGKDRSSVYDYAAGMDVIVSGTINETEVNVFDNSHNTQISGFRTDNRIFLYYHSDCTYISLRVTNNNFEGFDHGSSYHYNGSIEDNIVSLFDYEVSNYFKFRM